MVWFYFLILIPHLTAARRYDGPSYRSNIMDGDKPILRMSPNEDYAESNSDEGKRTALATKTKDPALVRDLSLLVSWLMENFSYDMVPMGRKNNNGVKESGKRILRMPPNDITDSDSDEDDDKVAPKIEITEALTKSPVKPPVDSENEDDDEVTEPLPLTKSPVKPPVDSENEDDDEVTEPLPLTKSPVKPPVDSENEDDDEVTEPLPLTKKPVKPQVDSKNGALRTKHKTKKHKEEEPNPEWLKDLKEFIKDLTTRYGQQEVLEHSKPVIASLEKKHNMKIKDVDVDEYGEIHITYIEKGKGKKTARKRKNTDQT